MPGSAPDVVLPSSQPTVLLQRLPHRFAPYPWHAFWQASVHAWQGSGITDLFLFPHQRCCICWCLLISIFAAYVFCALLQLYISAVLSWVPCRLRSVCHQYDTPELLFLSSLPWINNKNVMQRAGVKIQDKMDLMVLWNQCQARASSLAAQLGKPKAEGLTLPEWWGLFSCLLPQLCLTDVIILSSSVCKWTVILVQVIKRRHSADNWQIEVCFEPKPLERPARYYFQQNGSWLCNLCSLAPPPIQIIVGLRVLFNKFK